jgi:hypothetical protein
MNLPSRGPALGLYCTVYIYIWLEDRDSILGGVKIFSLRRSVRMDSEPNPARLLLMGKFPGVKRPKREADY